MEESSEMCETVIHKKDHKKENKGEADEIKCKKELFEKRTDIDYCVALFGINAQEGIELINMENGSPYENISDISKKTKSTSKSDVTILLKKTQELLHISIKSKRGQMPSIVNHTARSAHVFQLGQLKDDIINLDILAKEYHDERQKGTITEDVKISKFSSYANEEIKQSIIKMLIYFIFIGSGSKKSKEECNSILIIHKDASKNYISCKTEEEKES